MSTGDISNASGEAFQHVRAVGRDRTVGQLIMEEARCYWTVHVPGVGPQHCGRERPFTPEGMLKHLVELYPELALIRNTVSPQITHLHKETDDLVQTGIELPVNSGRWAYGLVAREFWTEEMGHGIVRRRNAELNDILQQFRRILRDYTNPQRLSEAEQRITEIVFSENLLRRYP